MTQHVDRQPEALERWLQQAPGTSPPGDLDHDVVEAVYALRPDLAPAPRLTAEDILASLTAGPLASPDAAVASGEITHSGAEVVPFPGRRSGSGSQSAPSVDAPVGDRTSRRQGRLWMWVGGTGGIGMALVAAATLLLVATPVLREAGLEDQPSRTASPAAAARPSLEADLQQQLADEGVAASAPDEQQLAEPTTTTAVARTDVRTGEVLPMAEAPAMRPADLIPELQEMRAGDAVADAEDAYEDKDELAPTASEEVATVLGAAAVGAEQAQAEQDLDRLRDSRAANRRQGNWRRGIDTETLAGLDAAIAQAEALRSSGALAQAAAVLEPLVGSAPTRAGQHLAALAAQDLLRAGDLARARAITERGLGLSAENGPERSALLVVYGDVLRQLGDRAGAADAYEQAR